MIPLAFTGKKGLGGVTMRGVHVAKLLGVPFIPVDQIHKHQVDTLVLVKYDAGFPVREHCVRLVWDPLDVFSQKNPEGIPCDYWFQQFGRLRFGTIIATSEACQHEMRLASDHVWLLPHHADPGLTLCHDPNGPIVYCGGRRYIDPVLLQVQEACGRIGRRLVLDFDRDAQKSLVGAALCLHPRCAPFDTPLNRSCKPQVKLENAAATQVPILCSDDPCVPDDVPKLADWSDVNALAAAMTEALDWRWSRGPVTIETHARNLMKLIRGKA